MSNWQPAENKDRVNSEANEYARTFNRFAVMHGCDVPMPLIAELVGLFEVALSPSVSDNDWQPIGNHPRDGLSFLVWCPENKCSYCVSCNHKGIFSIFGGGHYATLERTPTHWMTKPDPPSSE